MNRRNAIKTLGLSVASINIPDSTVKKNPIVISTWDFGLEANKTAWASLSKNGYALDGVEAGIRSVELDPRERSVGYGGRPDRDGKVTLDACIMDEKGNIGSVLCLENIATPISVARKVMEKTPHVMLSGKGAYDFATSQGFKHENLLVDESEKEWKEWLKTADYKPTVNIENHDTIGMVALDSNGRLCGGCSTSGMAFKMHGRIGDSPIIGAGLYVDGEVGAVTATGHGEEVVRVVGSFLVVELMRSGLRPKAACHEAVKRIKKKFELRKKSISYTQIGFIALSKNGEFGAYALRTGFTMAVTSNNTNRLIKVDSLI